ncbi:hypothetical protein V1264_024428 [Littorina saxatilis]|uniref:Uncharacterized protein n=2 Tax=Littorina saxatilis TaxID=31220 RepID=A0AAN9AM40_9CAEN
MTEKVMHYEQLILLFIFQFKPQSGKKCVSGDETCNGHIKLNLSNDVLESKVRTLYDQLAAVWNGTLQSDLHDRYMAGGASRRLLDHASSLSMLEDGQEDILMEVLMSMFSDIYTDDKLKQIDYMTRVFLPEALTRICHQVDQRQPAVVDVAGLDAPNIGTESFHPTAVKRHADFNLDQSDSSRISDPLSSEDEWKPEDEEKKLGEHSRGRRRCRTPNPSQRFKRRRHNHSGNRPVGSSETRRSPSFSSSSSGSLQRAPHSSTSSSSSPSRSHQQKRSFKRRRHNHSGNRPVGSSETRRSPFLSSSSSGSLQRAPHSSSSPSRSHQQDLLSEEPLCPTENSLHRRRKRIFRTRNRKQRPNGKKKRHRYHCPKQDCTAFCVNVQRHMRSAHPDLPEWEQADMIRNSRRKNEPKRQIVKKECCFTQCVWSGQRPDLHLMSKCHNLPRVEALKMAKICKVVDSVCQTGLHTAESLSKEFGIWLSSLEGGCYIPPDLDEKKKLDKQNQNKRTESMVKTILTESLGQEPFPIAKLALLKTLSRKPSAEKESVLEKIKGSKTWGTVKNFLASLSHFLDFVEITYPNLDIGGMRCSLAGTVRCINKFVAEDIQRRKDKIREVKIPEDLIVKYIDSQMAKRLISQEKKKGATTCKVADVDKIRNHILLHTAFLNGKRTGIFCAMTVTHVLNAREKGDLKVVLVDSGKTYRSSGSAAVHFSRQDYDSLVYFISNVRIANSNVDQVFCFSSGQEAAVSDINRFLQAAFDDFGIIESVQVPHVTCTLIRKTVITLLREQDIPREEQETVAKHMDHSIATADRHYDTSSGIQCTSKFRQILHRHVAWNEQDSDEDDCELLDNSVLESVQMEESEVSVIPSLPVSSTLTSTLTVEPTSSCLPSRFGKPEVFSKVDRERLRRCCAPFIQDKATNGGAVKQCDVVKHIKKAGRNFEDLFCNYSLKQLYNRVRMEIRMHKNKAK